MDVAASEPEGRGVAWTEERGTSAEGRRRLKAPRGERETLPIQSPSAIAVACSQHGLRSLGRVKPGGPLGTQLVGQANPQRRANQGGLQR